MSKNFYYVKYIYIKGIVEYMLFITFLFLKMSCSMSRLNTPVARHVIFIGCSVVSIVEAYDRWL